MESQEVKLCSCCIKPTNSNLGWAQREMLLQLNSLDSYHLHWLLQNILWVSKITNNRSGGAANSDVCSWFDLAINIGESSATNNQNLSALEISPSLCAHWRIVTSSKCTTLPVTLLALLIALPFKQVFIREGRKGKKWKGILTPSFLMTKALCILDYTDI